MGRSEKQKQRRKSGPAAATPAPLERPVAGATGETIEIAYSPLAGGAVEIVWLRSARGSARPRVG